MLSLLSARPLLIALAALALAPLGVILIDEVRHREALPSFEQQICGLEPRWLELVRRGYYQPRSGQISYLPRTPIYFAGGGDGWSHSGPWPYLQEVPLVFYGPGVIPSSGVVDPSSDVTLADVVPTLATLLQGAVATGDGRSLPEVARLERTIKGAPPRLIVTMVWDGAGWNTLNEHPDAWPALRRVMDEGVTLTADVGSSPSVTPAVHTTLGTGVFPATHGITGIPVLDEGGRAVDPFLEGDSGRFLEVPTLAERWDEQNENRALVGMIGHVPWHLGMIGQGAERPGGDKDHAAWLDLETNEWITNSDHFALPGAFQDQADLVAKLADLDREDGAEDSMWRRAPVDDPARFEELPAFAQHHMERLIRMIDEEGYGSDRIPDLLFTNLKQIDLLGHYFNMTSIEVRDAIAAVDRAMEMLIDHLDSEVGRGNYVLVMTSDHGQQPSAEALDSYGIDSNELTRDLETEFGPVVQDAKPTELFVDEEALDPSGATIEDVARFVGDYRLRDNIGAFGSQIVGTGDVGPAERLFELAVPARLLSEVQC